MVYASFNTTPAKASHIIDSNNYFTATNVEDALAELYAKFGTVTGGLDWQASVIDKDLTQPPGGETGGERYIVASAGALGDWSGKEDQITEYDGDTSSWDFMVPDDGVSCWVEDEDTTYVYTGIYGAGGSWVKLGTTIDHGNLGGLGDQIDHIWALTVDGTRPLTGDWAVGAHAISGITSLSMNNQLTNTLAIGTKPFVITSTTMCDNLNADLWDGYQFADYLNQDVKSTASPTFVQITFTNPSGADPYIYAGNNPGAAILYINGFLDVSTAAQINWQLTLVNVGGGDSPYLTANSGAGTRILQLTGDFVSTGTITGDCIYPEADLSDTLGNSLLTWLELYVQDIKDAAGNTIISNDGAGNIDVLATIADKIVATHSQAGMLDLNPSCTTDQKIIDIVPSANMAAGQTWQGLYVATGGLDPLTGATTIIHGTHMWFYGTSSADDNATIVGHLVDASASEYEIDFMSYGWGRTVAGNDWTSFYSILAVPLGVTATCTGLLVGWNSASRTANAPVLVGVNVQLPADYTNFGANKAGYFAGDGRSVTICDTTYALNVSGAMQLDGVITAINSITLDAGTTIDEFSTDGTMGGNSDSALPTESAVVTYVAAQIGGIPAGTLANVLASGNEADGTNMLLDSASDLIMYSDDKVTTTIAFDGGAGLIDLNPLGTGSQNIIDITPTTALVAGSTWKAIHVDLNALDPATGAACDIHGVEIDASGLDSADGDTIYYNYFSKNSATESGAGFWHDLVEMTADKYMNGFVIYDNDLVLSTTATYRGFVVDFNGLTRDAGAPVLEGLKIELPANYTDFGTSFAGYFTGDGRAVTICDTTYALDISGASRTDNQITSTLAVGTSPFAVTSTTVNTNLNADLWDGYQFSDYLDQAVKQASSPTFVGLTLSGAIGTPTNITMSGDIISANALNFKISGDNDDYFQMETPANIPTLNSIGASMILNVATGEEFFIHVNDAEKLGIDANGLILGNSGARVTTILDEDAMGTNSDTALATQQSIKAYVDTAVGGAGGDAFKTITGITNDVVADSVADTLTLASANNRLTIVGTAATDTITFTFVESNVVCDGNTMQFDGINSNGGAFNFTTSGAITFNQNISFSGAQTVDGVDISTHAGNSAAHHAVFTELSQDASPQLGGDLDLNGHAIDFPTTANITDCLDEDNMISDSNTKICTQQSIKKYVDDNAGMSTTTQYVKEVFLTAQAMYHTGGTGTWANAADVGGIVGRYITAAGGASQYMEGAFYVDNILSTTVYLDIWYGYKAAGTDTGTLYLWASFCNQGDAGSWNINSNTSHGFDWTGDNILQKNTITLSDADLSGDGWFSFALSFASLDANSHYLVGVSLRYTTDHS
jgi:hypothetical protein